MLTYDLTARGNTPIYEYLYRCLRSDILSGALEVGGRLPSRRSFAEHLGVSVITVDAAYSLLEAEGCIRAYEKVVDGRSRRYYSITRKGKEQLARERTQWETFSAAVTQILGGPALA